MIQGISVFHFADDALNDKFPTHETRDYTE